MIAALAIVQVALLLQAPPVFRVGTRLVQVNVVVHDRHLQPVTVPFSQIH